MGNSRVLLDLSGNTYQTPTEKGKKVDQLQKARDLKTELLKGHNINDPQQVKELAIVKDLIAQLETQLENQENK